MCDRHRDRERKRGRLTITDRRNGEVVWSVGCHRLCMSVSSSFDAAASFVFIVVSFRVCDSAFGGQTQWAVLLRLAARDKTIIHISHDANNLRCVPLLVALYAVQMVKSNEQAPDIKLTDKC